MNLSRTERLILANQYRILELLTPKEREFYERQREALEQGFEGGFETIHEHVYADTLSAEAGKEVVAILSMFRALHHSFAALVEKSGIDPYDITFHGFDGNDAEEGKCMSYARWFCSEGKQGRFAELKGHDDFNSHSESLPVYRRMLSEWRRSADANHLSKTDIQRIASVGIERQDQPSV